MAYRVVFTPDADRDLADLFDFIADQSGPERAHAFVRKIREYCLRFDLFPERGTRRDDLRPGLRTVGFQRRATVVFTVDESAVVILSDYYRGRDFERDFANEAEE